MHASGHTLQAIADEINRIEKEAAEQAGLPLPKPRSKSTISRELKRNRTKTGRYNPKSANEYAMIRRGRIVRNTAVKPGVMNRALKLLKERHWSPEQISGYLKLQGISISKESIYKVIRADKTGELALCCHHHMKYRHHLPKPYAKAGKSLIPNRVPIQERPAEADGKRFGDWEMDLVMGKEQKSQVLTIIERSQNMFYQLKLTSKKPEEVAEAVIRLLLPFKKYVHTITTDNGIEFMHHEKICKALGCTVYFADPYCSGQKGAIENANKILREYFPNGTDFREITQEQLNHAQYEINMRPRKKLGFSNPKTEFFKRIA